MSTIVEAYQALVWKELKEKLEVADWNFEKPSTYLIDADLAPYKEFIQELEYKGLLIRYAHGYRTAHVDLLYRLTKIRYFRHRTPIPLERELSIMEEPVPDHGSYNLRDVLRRAGISNTEADLIDQAVVRGEPNFNGLSTYQQHYINTILQGVYKYFGVVAPTASGKSLVFFIPVLVKAIQRLNAGKRGVACVMLYPRKALARDQLQRMLHTIDFLNQFIGDKLTVAIDDGDTLRMQQDLREKDSVEFRGLTCPRSILSNNKKEQCGKKLFLSRDGTIKCETGHNLNYIISNRKDMVVQKPLILVTNIWRAYHMMLKKGEVELLQNLDLVAMDECHVYTGYSGGHIALIIRLLRYLSSSDQNLTTFIFSSATISNPRQFLANLAGISEEELFYHDYRSLVPPSSNRRLLIHLYLLPAPEGGSAETLTEAVMEAVALWCNKHKFKSIMFADSVSTVTTFWSYFHDTILSPKREAREIIDHVFDEQGTPLNKPDDDYSWYTLIPPKLNDRYSLKNFLLNDFKNSIDIHYGSLKPSERAKRELKLKQDRTRLMIATSTLELGIDLSDIAVIIQYKLPIRPEGVSQRVGRGGRVNKCYKISLGIIILPSNPTGTLYMYNKDLREKLEKVEALPPLRIGERSMNLILMHALTMLLLMRNINGKETFRRIRSIAEAAEACRKLRQDLSHVLEFNRSVRLFDEQSLKRALDELDKALAFSDDMINGGINIENAIQKLEAAQGYCFDMWMHAREFLQFWPRELGSPHHLLGKLEQLLGQLQADLRRAVKDVKDAVVRKRLPDLPKIEQILPRLPDPDETSDVLFNWLGGIKQRDYRKSGVTREKFSNIINNLTEKYRTMKEEYLQEAASILQKLSTLAQDFHGVVNSSLRRRIEEEIRAEQEFGRSKGIDIFKLMEILIAGRRIFSPLLAQPWPKLRVEEKNA